MAQRLTPGDLLRFDHLEEESWPSHVLPMFSMPRERLFAALVRQDLLGGIFRACAESQAAKHSRRQGAMQSPDRILDDRQA